VARIGSAGSRPQAYAYFISVPLALLTAVLLGPLASDAPPAVRELPQFALFTALFVLAQATMLHFEVRRHAFTLSVTEIPLLVGLMYLSPVTVILARVLSLVIVQAWQRVLVVRVLYNVASVGLATTTAALIVHHFRPHGFAGLPAGFGPWTWLVLALAVFVATAITLGGVIGVVALIQGLPPVASMIRSLASLLAVAAFNITVGLIVLISWRAEPWSLLLFAGIGAMLVVVYRSYAQFVLQHRSLAELYELTRSMADAGRDGTLPDVLLAGVRELLQAESATRRCGR